MLEQIRPEIQDHALFELGLQISLQNPQPILEQDHAYTGQNHPNQEGVAPGRCQTGDKIVNGKLAAISLITPSAFTARTRKR